MPLRVALTVRNPPLPDSAAIDVLFARPENSCCIAWQGKMAGTDIGDQLSVLALENGDVAHDSIVRLPERIEMLRKWSAAQ